MWFLKLGLYKLHRPKDRTGTWIHIVDATIQMGPQKAVLVLGLRLTGTADDFSPTFERLEPLVLMAVTSCPGEVIKEALEKATELTGAAAATLSDAGSEMDRGTRLMSSTVPTIHVHDCLHKTSNVLKAILKKDERWAAFTAAATTMTQSVKLSDVAHLAPPKQRSKARLMASVGLVVWGGKLLTHVDSKPDLPAHLMEKLEWITEYRKDLPVWMEGQQLCTATIKTVLESGYHAGTAAEWEGKIGHIEHVTEAVKSVYDGLKSFLEIESAKVPVGKSYPGCSAIIESVFGKFKSLEGQFCNSGLTGLILALPALVGPTTMKDVEEAMASVHEKDVEDWWVANVGVTYRSKRRTDLPPAKV